MRPSTFFFSLLPVLASAQTQTGSAGPEASGKTHWVSVGEDGLTFSPDSLKAEVGDQVSFSFYPSNHAVVRSTFDKPCAPMPANMDGAIYSGFPDTSDGESVCLQYSSPASRRSCSPAVTYRNMEANISHLGHGLQRLGQRHKANLALLPTSLR